MPELPEIEAYLAALETHLGDALLTDVRLASPFLLRSVDPPLGAARGRRLVGRRRLGKRVVLELEGELFLVLHLMIAGRLRWRSCGAAIPGKVGLAAFDFERGTLLLTEASGRKRASLFVVAGEAGLAAHDPGGLDPLAGDRAAFAAALRAANHTVKRALTDPRILAGIGNAWSDEILFEARLSPFQRTHALSEDQLDRLHQAVRVVLAPTVERYVAEARAAFPEKVTAFPPGMAVHGRYRAPCPRCGKSVQRIVYAGKNESNYCAHCQTGGRLLADRALSRLLKDDWPKRLEDME